jgi:hypothetical protein
MAYFVKFSFDGANRKRDVPVLPRVGEIVELHDDDERIVLRVDLVVHFEDLPGQWEWHCNCTIMKNWLEK